MKLSQTAGKVEIAVWTDGYPYWPEIIFRDSPDVRPSAEVKVDVAALHDLRYCIERILAQLPAR